MQAAGTGTSEITVSLERRQDGSYTARVQTPEGTGKRVFAVPDEDLTLDAPTSYFSDQRAIKRSSSGAVRDRAVEIGQLLFHDLFAGVLRALYERTAAPGHGVRIRVSSHDLAAFALPWELLYDDAVRQDFIALGTDSAVVRTFLPVPERELTPATMPLRVLAVTADPTGSLGAEQDVDVLRGLAADRSHVSVDVLPRATWSRLRERLREGPPFEVLHFAGTGTPAGERHGAPQMLALEPGTDGEDTARTVAAELLGAELARLPDLRLAYLSACHTDQVAATLSRSVPAVVGVRGEITVPGCTAFAEAFYSAAVDGRPVDVAVWSARRELESRLPGRREWAATTLYVTGGGALVHELDVVRLPADATLAVTMSNGGDPPARQEEDLRSLHRSLVAVNLQELEAQLAVLGPAAPEAMLAQRDRLQAELHPGSGPPEATP
ncbi:CHAT domain-containing protein [Geodermatophilus sp. SYSU D00742]